MVLRQPIEQMAGGSALNTACQLGNLVRLLGAGTPWAVDLHTIIGVDPFGQFLRSALKPPVTLSSPSDDNLRTGACICLSGSDDRCFLTYRGAIGELALRHLNMDLVLEADALYIGGFYNCPELWPSVPDLLATCKLKGMTTLLSPQYDATEEWLGLDVSVWRHLDVLIANEVEALAISRRSGVVEAAHALLDEGVKLVVVTQGGAGAFVARRDESTGAVQEFRQPCKSVQVVDTTGAGDAFAAGFVFEYLRSGGDVREALRLGCALGTCLVQRIGASATPSLEDIRANHVTGAEGVREKH